MDSRIIALSACGPVAMVPLMTSLVKNLGTPATDFLFFTLFPTLFPVSPLNGFLKWSKLKAFMPCNRRKRYAPIDKSLNLFIPFTFNFCHRLAILNNASDSTLWKMKQRIHTTLKEMKCMLQKEVWQFWLMKNQRNVCLLYTVLLHSFLSFCFFHFTYFISFLCYISSFFSFSFLISILKCFLCTISSFFIYISSQESLKQLSKRIA